MSGRRIRQLPAEVSGFVGRQDELDTLTALLRTERLVTVTGPGGAAGHLQANRGRAPGDHLR
jgi:hypothetical protein